MTLIDDRLYIDPELVQFYDLENYGGPDLDYCIAFAAGARTVLDLGCGTGQVAVKLAPGRKVTGVDPAGAMLAVARQRPGGQDVEWVEADARNMRLSKKFDLVLLTGHAFQVFLTAKDQQAALATIAAHLAPEGRFIFDSRNPVAREWLEWVPEESQRLVEHPRLGTVKAWNDAAWDEPAGIVTYDTYYEAASGQKFHAASKIAFPNKDTLAGMMDVAGLAVGRWLGDWHGGPNLPMSPEIIPIGRLR